MTGNGVVPLRLGKRRYRGAAVKEAELVKLLAQGLTQEAAYRQAFRPKGVNPDAIRGRANKLANKPEVALAVRELLKAARINDLDSAGQWITDALAAQQEAKTDRNWTGYAALHRQRGQALGVLHDRLQIQGELHITDTDLIARLSGGDLSKASVLAEMLGSATSYVTKQLAGPAHSVVPEQAEDDGSS